MKLPTRQEMFNRAARGLKRQGFMRSMRGTGCAYDDGAGKRCAWGHVDSELNGTHGIVALLQLREHGCGLAAYLLIEDVKFAQGLQEVHDHSRSSKEMRSALLNFAKQYSLHTQELK